MLFPLGQEVDCALSILQREGTRLGAELGPMVPVVLCPAQGGPPPVLAEGPGCTRSRKVFLSTPQGEDMWWSTESVNFVIDAGVQKKMVSCDFHHNTYFKGVIRQY